MGSDPPASMARGRRCERHGLGAGPDGRCALCRSESLPRQRPYASWVIGGMLFAVLLPSAGVVAYRATHTLTQPVAIVSEPQDPATPDAGPSPETAPVPVQPSGAAPRAGESVPLNEPIPPPVVVALDPAERVPLPGDSPSARDVPKTASSAATARAQPTPAELRTAFAATPIVMYSTSWCPVCRKAKRFLAENGLTYREIDADATPGGWDKIQSLAGRRAVPVIVVDGDVSQGLSPQRIMHGVARSMERRLGVAGIAFQQAN
jgi:glutaredoxin 3